MATSSTSTSTTESQLSETWYHINLSGHIANIWKAVEDLSWLNYSTDEKNSSLEGDSANTICYNKQLENLKSTVTTLEASIEAATNIPDPKRLEEFTPKFTEMNGLEKNLWDYLPLQAVAEAHKREGKALKRKGNKDGFESSRIPQIYESSEKSSEYEETYENALHYNHLIREQKPTIEERSSPRTPVASLPPRDSTSRAPELQSPTHHKKRRIGAS
ncbi:hypothetical protein B0H11DRAFT_1925756 [Mycena galericulata]|nr:hypothetical protein B0H11DRAFT_1925756 [Mycena galericulata]